MQTPADNANGKNEYGTGSSSSLASLEGYEEAEKEKKERLKKEQKNPSMFEKSWLSPAVPLHSATCSPSRARSSLPSLPSVSLGPCCMELGSHS
mmetsp:Transcript_72555/g.201236  ORF Transcript_72555/g.201236 Transcript_72555/m.201236 type:complete len:94 (+) Transcript_72555:95-376(+)